MAKITITEGLVNCYCSSKKIPPPFYETFSHTLSSNETIFECRCLCNGIVLSAKGTTREKAKHNVARLMSIKLGCDTSTTLNSNLSMKTPEPSRKLCNVEKDYHPATMKTPEPISNFKPCSDKETQTEKEKNPVEILNEYCAERKYPLPIYTDAGNNGRNIYAKCSFQGCKTKGWAATLNDAKQRAAYKMLQKFGLAPSPKITALHKSAALESSQTSTSSASNLSGGSEHKTTNQKRRKHCGVTEIFSSMYVYTVKELKSDDNIEELSKIPFIIELDRRM